MREEEIEYFNRSMKINFRWNFIVNTMDFLIGCIGLGLVTSATILPAFVRHLTSSNIAIGLIPSVGLLMYTLPQIFIARHIESLSIKKPYVILFGFGERIQWLLLALTTVFLYESKDLCLISFFIIYSVGNLSMGAGTVPWLDMLAKVLGEKFGFFFGFSSFFLGGISSLLGAILGSQILEHYAYPYNFALCFLIAFIFVFISYICVSSTREPPYPVTKKDRDSLRNYLWRLLRTFRKDKNFALFMVATILLNFTGMSTSFYVLYAIDKLGLADSDVTIFNIMLLTFQIMMGLLWGYLGHRKGFKLILELGVVSSIFATLMATVAYSKLTFYVVFALMGCGTSAQSISQWSIIPDFCTPEDRPLYLVISNTIKAPFALLPPIFGGLLASRYGYPPVFLLTISIIAFGLGLLHFVKEPRISRKA